VLLLLLLLLPGGAAAAEALVQGAHQPVGELHGKPQRGRRQGLLVRALQPCYIVTLLLLFVSIVRAVQACKRLAGESPCK
jgi:hypothetical protein